MKKVFTAESMIYSTRCFKYDKENRVFIGRITDVMGVLRQLFPDRLDLGFSMHSDRTGRVVNFVLTSMETDAEGVPTAWIFSPVDAPEEAKDVTVKVYR
jgi:hypothetical protein